jgi:hypothetical protein
MSGHVKHSERRKGLPAVPPRFEREKLLNVAQLLSIRQLEQAGWILTIVRRIDLDEPVALLKNAGGSRWKAVAADGSVIDDPEIPPR